MNTKAEPEKRGRAGKFLRWTVLILLLSGAAFVYFRYFWVFGEGAKSGEMNYVVRKGYLFKTYEGKLIQTGLRGQSGSIQSNEFIFSVEDPRVAEELMMNSGLHFNLHYKEYVGALPWRGMSVYVVDSIISMDPARSSPGGFP